MELSLQFRKEILDPWQLPKTIVQQQPEKPEEVLSIIRKIMRTREVVSFLFLCETLVSPPLEYWMLRSLYFRKDILVLLFLNQDDNSCFSMNDLKDR